MSCYYAGPEQPRMLAGRHLAEGCECRGCQPCEWGHCRVCSVTHAEHTCGGCLSETREALTEIRRLCAALPAEVLHKGIDSEAMNLLGPIADPEALGHVQASVNVGRVPAHWLETADHELHPLLVCGTWMEAYIEAFEHPEPAGRITIGAATSYLDRNLSYASTFADVPFEDFARNLRQCQTHMERVLHDGEQVETGAPCMKCEGDEVVVRLELVRGEREDRWQCPRCKRQSNEAQYELAVRQTFIERSPELNADDMAIRIEVASSTIRRWSHVLRTQAAGEDPVEHPPILNSVGVVNGRKVYLVADAEAIRDSGGDQRRRQTRNTSEVA